MARDFAIYFRGDFLADTPTANNNNVDYLIDADNVKLTDYWAVQDDTTLVSWLKSLEQKESSSGPAQQLPSYWDYYGDNSFTLQNVSITGATGIADIANDPAIGSDVTLQGHLAPAGYRTKAQFVDLDPTAVTITQIFNDRFSFSNSNGDSFVGDGLSRAYTDWIFFGRNLNPPDGPASASAVFQSAIDPSNMTIENPNNSQILAALAQAKADGKKLVIQYCLYYCAPSALSPEELAAEYEKGNKPQNPKPGKILGTIIPWDDSLNTVESMPPGRLLQPVRLSDENSDFFALGPALVEIDYTGHTIVLNLINTIPETGPSLDKVDLGTLTLEVVYNSTSYTVGTLSVTQYAKAAYESTAGLVEFSFDASLDTPLQNGSLQLSASSPPPVTDGAANPVLQEVAYAIETDDRALYIDLGTDEPGLNQNRVNVKVFQRGVPVAGKTVRIGQERSIMTSIGNPAKPPTEPPTVGSAPSQGYQGEVVTFDSATAVTDASGVATFTLQPNSAGTACLYFWVDGEPEPTGINDFMLRTIPYSHVRVLPDNDDLDDKAATWDNVYQEVMRYYYILYPFMNGIIPMDDEGAMAARGPQIIVRTGLNEWHKTIFMPTTREMSAGNRRFLHRWLESAIADAQSSTAAPSPATSKKRRDDRRPKGLLGKLLQKFGHRLR